MENEIGNVFTSSVIHDGKQKISNECMVSGNRK